MEAPSQLDGANTDPLSSLLVAVLCSLVMDANLPFEESAPVSKSEAIQTDQ